MTPDLTPPYSTPGRGQRRQDLTPPVVRWFKPLFYGIFLGIYASLLTTLGAFVIRWSWPPSVVLFGVLSVLFLGGAYGLTRQITALIIGARPLPQLSALSRSPRVAMLYTTMNDVVPECVRAIRSIYPVDVYILDDSSDPNARATVDRLVEGQSFTVIRRGARRGFKAGAINDWLKNHGGGYDYFVLLDADSYLPPDWVGEALRFAEHPDNKRVAIFQGLINIWNLDSEFVQVLAPMARVGQFVWEQTVANALDAVFCYGHNVLVRTSAVREIGGFVEGYVSEDFATAVALSEKNWHSRFIPLHTYEATPENVRGFLKRQRKWTRGAMEFFGFARRSTIGPGQKFLLLQTPIGHVANLLIPVGMFLTVFGYASTPAAAAAFLTSLLHNPFATIWSVLIFRYLILLGILGSIPSIVVLLKCRIGWSTYWRHRFLSSATSVLMLPYEFSTMFRYLLTPFQSIPVTPKTEAPLAAGEVLYLARYSLLLFGLLAIGIATVNPLAGLFNATWLLPMLLAPAVVYRYGGPAIAISGSNDTLPREWMEPSAWIRSPRGVHTSLLRIREGLFRSPTPGRFPIAPVA